MKIKVFIIIGLLGLLSQSCGKKRNTKTILSNEKLIEVILDLQIAKAATYKHPVEDRDSINTLYNEQVYEIHNVDLYEFEADIRKLKSRPKEYKKLLEDVSEKLKIMQNIEGQKEMEE